MKQIKTDILVTYIDGSTWQSLNIMDDFDSIVTALGRAKRKKGFCILNGFAFNPHYITTIKKLEEGERK